jgi:outer membrane protein assembly factor BamB
MKRTFVCSAGMLLGLWTVIPTFAENWPAWRGGKLSGVSSEKGLPLRWSETDNVRWRVPLPGPGNSSPIVWGDRVFVSQAVERENRRTLMCFDRTDGRLLWQKGVTYTGDEPTHETNPYCAGSPATDGELVYVCFGSPGVYAYDFNGNEVWHRELGRLTHVFGTAVSPIVYGDLCIVNFGPGEGARLVALNKKTGETVWEVKPPTVDPSELAPAGGRFGGPGGPGGPGGRGGFGPGMILAPQILSQADKDANEKLTPQEFTALADAWFDKLDPDKQGQLTQQQFVERLQQVLPPPQGFGPPRRPDREGTDREDTNGRPARRGGFGPGRFVGPGLFTALDSNKDGSLTGGEMKDAFSKWSTKWDTEKSGTLTEDQLREGLTAALPPPNFGGPGFGGPGRGPGGRGRGGPAGFAQLGGSWSTPVIVHAPSRDELLLSFPGRLVAYDPYSGDELWISKGIGGAIYTSPVAGEGVVFATTSGMGGGGAIAVKPGGGGDVTDSQRIWRLERVESQIGSGVIHDGHLYTMSQEGIASCLDLQSGKTVWEKRLRGSGSRGGSWSSMLLADGKIYIPNQSGDVFVLVASPKFELLATNSVNETTNASLAASNGELFMRTDESLWCFAVDDR